jgi:hypothetical protein
MRSIFASQTDDTPYCKNCGYILAGLIDSSKCPECGQPIVEVLVRDSFPGAKGYRYESPMRIAGLPLLSVASGPHGRERFGKPRGIIAIGDHPRGVVAIGGMPVGVIAIGGVARGIISFGGVSIGVVAIGGCTIGAAALGGIAAGLYAFGGMAAYILSGAGGASFRIPLW